MSTDIEVMVGKGLEYPPPNSEAPTADFVFHYLSTDIWNSYGVSGVHHCSWTCDGRHWRVSTDILPRPQFWKRCIDGNCTALRLSQLNDFHHKHLKSTDHHHSCTCARWMRNRSCPLWILWSHTTLITPCRPICMWTLAHKLSVVRTLL